MSIQLSDEQKIREYMAPYGNWLKTDEANEWLAAEKERMDSYKKLLHRDNVEKLTEEEIGSLRSGLWAMKFWTSKDWALKRFFEKNDMNIFRRELKMLLWGDEPIQDRYDRFREHVWGMGAAAVTEILAFMNPDSCGIWNEKVRRACSVDSLILNLQRAKNNPTVQKLVVVANTKTIRAIKEEASSAEVVKEEAPYIQ